ncbi:amine dehydrogenase large subunit [Hydrocarboniclastica marina]|nr:amine dehydrogenase large subunit [Hydrocarboniclastica marina]
MRVLGITLGAVLGVLAVGGAQADDDFEPEVLTVEESIEPGANLFLLDQSWQGASRLNVLAVEDLAHKGNLSMGLVAQMALSRDRKTAYTISAYAKRITYGPTEAVLQIFDVDTLTLKSEVIIPDKMSQVAPSNAVLQLSADDRYAFIQNATPATSVTIVDTKAGEVIAEVPTPGCFGIYPALDSQRFSTLCGDGTMAAYDFEADGEFSAPVRSKKLFDPDEDALFIMPERVGKDLVFPSFKGNLYRISDAGTPRLVDKFSLTEGIEGDWAPGGVDVMAYNASHDVMFVLMHPDAEEGSHKNGAEELWAVDMDAQEVLYRSAVGHLASIAVTPGEEPVLFGMSEESEVVRYEIAPEARFAAKPTATLEGAGDWTVYAIAGG